MAQQMSQTKATETSQQLSNKNVNIHYGFMYVLAFTTFSALFEYKACTTLGTRGAMVSYQGLRTLQ